MGRPWHVAQQKTALIGQMGGAHGWSSKTKGELLAQVQGGELL